MNFLNNGRLQFLNQILNFRYLASLAPPTIRSSNVLTPVLRVVQACCLLQGIFLQVRCCQLTFPVSSLFWLHKCNLASELRPPEARKGPRLFKLLRKSN